MLFEYLQISDKFKDIVIVSVAKRFHHFIIWMENDRNSLPVGNLRQDKRDIKIVIFAIVALLGYVSFIFRVICPSHIRLNGWQWHTCC